MKELPKVEHGDGDYGTKVGDQDYEEQVRTKIGDDGVEEMHVTYVQRKTIRSLPSEKFRDNYDLIDWTNGTNEKTDTVSENGS